MNGVAFGTGLCSPPEMSYMMTMSCCLIKLTVHFSCFSVSYHLIYIASCFQNITTLLTKHWLVSTIMNLSVRLAHASFLSWKHKRSWRRINCCWTFVCMSENCKPAWLCSVAKNVILVTRLSMTTYKRNTARVNLHWNKIDFCFVSSYSVFKVLNKVLLKHFLTWSTDFGFRFYLVLFAALVRSPNINIRKLIASKTSLNICSDLLWSEGITEEGSKQWQFENYLRSAKRLPTNWNSRNLNSHSFFDTE